jgi:DNA-binding NarL/FixJ family response regulator
MAQMVIDSSRSIGQTLVMSTPSVLVCDRDDLGRRSLARAVTDHGLEVCCEASTAVQVLAILDSIWADVIVIANDLLGMSGIEVTPELVAAGHRVVLVSSDPVALDQARRAGAYAAVSQGDLESFGDALEGIAALDGTGGQGTSTDRRSGTPRRSGLDRRVEQNWRLVTSERRVADRRQADRRVDAAPAQPAPTSEPSSNWTPAIA